MWQAVMLRGARVNIGYWGQLIAQHSGEGGFELSGVLSKDNPDT